MKVRAWVGAWALAVVCMGTVTSARQQPASPSQSSGPPVRLTPAEVEIYKWAPTLTNWTAQQVRNCPLLKKLGPAANQDQLPMVLERVGQTATILFQAFPRISCDEEVVSETYRGRWIATKHKKFRYIVLPRPVGNVLGFEEYRTDANGNPLDAAILKDFVTTSNFASNWLYLSPADQRDNHFRYFGTQSIRNRECHVVGFAQDPERVRSAGVISIGGHYAILLVQGMAWVDSQTYEILRIVTWLLAPREDIDLSSQNSTVDFYPVQPSGSERVLWLPRDVTVEAVYQGVSLRSTHHYSDFKLFRVESTIKPGR